MLIITAIAGDQSWTYLRAYNIDMWSFIEI